MIGQSRYWLYIGTRACLSMKVKHTCQCCSVFATQTLRRYLQTSVAREWGGEEEWEMEKLPWDTAWRSYAIADGHSVMGIVLG